MAKDKSGKDLKFCRNIVLTHNPSHSLIVLLLDNLSSLKNIVTEFVCVQYTIIKFVLVLWNEVNSLHLVVKLAKNFPRNIDLILSHPGFLHEVGPHTHAEVFWHTGWFPRLYIVDCF